MKSAYRMIPPMLIAHFVAMYAVMYTMVDQFDDVYNSLNNAYMAGMMAAPMLPLMLLFMPSMYPDRKKNVVLTIGAVVVFGVLFWAMRTQALIADRQFVRSMIPHHSGAILMCGQSTLTDPELKTLCDTIIKGQADEISQMKKILQRLSD